jgi:hypothetical protein
MHFNTWETSEDIFFERIKWILKLADLLLSQQTCDKIILIMDSVLK